MKDRKSIHVLTFVFVSMAILLLSPIIGTTVWAKPGKPPSEPETADFEIRIGEGSGTQDITLNPPDSFLYVESEVGGYWLPPPTEGKAQREVWGVGLLEEQGHDCGTYIVADVEGDSGYGELGQILAEHGVDSTVEARFFYIGHRNTQNARPPEREGEWDYWHIIIQWQVGTMEIENPDDPENPFIIPHLHTLEGDTNTDAEWEGAYDKDKDIWTITFDNAEFSLWENTENWDEIEELWIGQLSFAVEIKRILS